MPSPSRLAFGPQSPSGHDFHWVETAGRSLLLKDVQ